MTKPPFCEDSYLSLRLQPSFIDKQIIHDQWGASQLVYRGEQPEIDAADPRIAIDGLVFTGTEKITATALGISGHSLTVAAWVFLDGAYAGVLQGLVSGTDRPKRPFRSINIALGRPGGPEWRTLHQLKWLFQ